jgi:hypothetical protein
MAEERLLGCPTVGGLHTKEFSDPNDGICRGCGVSRAGPPVDTVMLVDEAEENATRERRGYVPLTPTQPSPAARPPLPKTMRAVIGGRVMDVFVDGPLQQALEGCGKPVSEGQCDQCAQPLQTQPGLTDEDMAELAKLTTVASRFLCDPHPGIAHWGMMTSDTLNAISAILRRSGI